MRDKAVDDCLAALKFVLDWFVTSKMIKILLTAFYADESVLCFNEDSGNLVHTCNGMGILNIDLNNINLDGTNYEKDDPDTMILIRFLTWHIQLGKRKALQTNISDKLMSIVGHPKRCWSFCVSEFLLRYFQTNTVRIKVIKLIKRWKCL